MTSSATSFRDIPVVVGERHPVHLTAQLLTFNVDPDQQGLQVNARVILHPIEGVLPMESAPIPEVRIMMHSRWCERHDKLDDRKAQYIDELIKSADPVMSRVNSSGILYITLTLPEGKAILRASCFDSMFNWGLHSASHGQGHMYFKAMNTEIDDDILGALKYSGHGALAESLWQHWNLPF